MMDRPTVADRASLIAEGYALASRAERRCGFTPADRARAREIVAQLDLIDAPAFGGSAPRTVALHPPRPTVHPLCGGLYLPEFGPLSRCARCGAEKLGR
jgi:hypothetical protein